MKKIILIAIAFTLPLTTHAAFWSDWFKKPPVSIQATSTPPKVVEKVIEVPVEKVVERIITKDNPDQQQKIYQLETEIEILKDKLALCETPVTNKANKNSTGVSVKMANKFALIQNNKMGSVRARITVTAGTSDLLIPKTTTDSSKSTPGLNYKIEGGNFTGWQTSTVTCSSTKQDGSETFCSVRAGEKIDLEILMGYDPDLSGTYSVTFDKLNYWVVDKGVYESYKFGDEGVFDPLYVQ